MTKNIFGQKDTCKFKQTFFPSKKVEEEGCLKKGKRDGIWKTYIEYDGKHYVRFIWTYRDGLKDGPYKALGETGIIEATGTYKQGCLVDTVKSYNDEGQLTDYQVWQIDNLKTQSSKKIASKVIIPSKPDYTTEIINGKKYMWISGRKYETK